MSVLPALQEEVDGGVAVPEPDEGVGDEGEVDKELLGQPKKHAVPRFPKGYNFYN